jgi:hypothetical protein
VDAGTDAPARAGAAGNPIGEDAAVLRRVEAQIRKLVGNDQIDVMLDNIGLPYSGINIALSDSATVGPMDGEILISLNKKHTPTAQNSSPCCAGELPARFAELQFFFPARRHRRSGAQFRPAGAHRRANLRAGSGAAFALASRSRAP